LRSINIQTGASMNDEQQIRELIARWAAAAHAGDMDGVLVDHARDIVMFDVPPPSRAFAD
jgi:ketosteroid isomerase-like protein